MSDPTLEDGLVDIAGWTVRTGAGQRIATPRTPEVAEMAVRCDELGDEICGGARQAPRLEASFREHESSASRKRLCSILDC